jgi:hypothetical protein
MKAKQEMGGKKKQEHSRPQTVICKFLFPCPGFSQKFAKTGL